MCRFNWGYALIITCNSDIVGGFCRALWLGQRLAAFARYATKLNVAKKRPSKFCRHTFHACYFRYQGIGSHAKAVQTYYRIRRNILPHYVSHSYPLAHAKYSIETTRHAAIWRPAFCGKNWNLCLSGESKGKPYNWSSCLYSFPFL